MKKNSLLRNTLRDTPYRAEAGGCPVNAALPLREPSLARRSGPHEQEFVALVALQISMVAMSIDALLPALTAIASDLGVTQDNDRQQVISVFFLGLAFGQLIYGPLSDHTGRNPAIYAGLMIFMGGSLLSAFAPSFEFMLAGRLLQGLGAAGPRIVVVAMVRDLYQGRAMARIMSMVMAVFIIVPAVAPAVGQGILAISHWRAILGVLLGMAVIALTWSALRQPESLPRSKRTPLSLRRLLQSIREISRNRITLGYTIAQGLVFGAFLGYLTSAQQILQDLYGVGDLFPLYFGVLALALGGASFANSKLVARHGMSLLCRCALVTLTGLGGSLFLYGLLLSTTPALWLLMTCLVLSFFCIGILFGNLNALAMEPQGHIAGVAAAYIGSLATFISLPLGAAIGAGFDGSVLPLLGGFAGLGSAAFVATLWAGGGHRKLAT